MKPVLQSTASILLLLAWMLWDAFVFCLMALIVSSSMKAQMREILAGDGDV